MFGRGLARQFRLTPDGVACGENGLAIGGVRLLARPLAARRCGWVVRPVADLDAELSRRYGMVIDVSGKAQGIAVVARALDDGNIALAQIAALLLRFPDPPRLGKQASAPAFLSLASELIFSGLLKGDWNPDAHPRTGTAPNRGWFASVPRDPKATGGRGLSWHPRHRFELRVRTRRIGSSHSNRRPPARFYNRGNRLVEERVS
jgi:hypothetical protein